MPKVMPDVITTNKVGDINRILLVYIEIPGGSYYWSTKAIIVTRWLGAGSVNFLGGVILEDGFSSISEAVDVEDGGNVAEVSGFTVRIANPQFSSNNRFDQQLGLSNLENKTIEIWLALVDDGATEVDYYDLANLKTGTIKDIKYDYGVFQIDAEDSWLLRHRNIPQCCIINETDYPNAPPENLGKNIPLLYGELRLSAASIIYNRFFEVPTLLVDKLKNIFAISKNQIKELDANGYSYCALYDSSTKSLLFLKFGDGTPAETLINEYPFVTTIQFPQGSIIYAVIKKQMQEQGSQTYPTYLNLDEAVDQSATSYISIDNLEGVSEKAYFKVTLPSGMFTILEGSSISFGVSFKTIYGTGKLKYYNPEWDNGIGGFSTGVSFGAGDSDAIKYYEVAIDKTKHGKMDLQEDQNDDWLIEELNSYEFGIECDASSGAQIKNVFILISGVIVYRKAFYLTDLPGPIRLGVPKSEFFQPEILHGEVNNLSVGVIGEPFGSWARGDKLSTSVIENTAIIECILRMELGIGSDDIDYTSFNTAGMLTTSDRWAWKHSGMINDQTYSLDIIRDLCRHFGSIYYTNYRDQEKIVVIKKRTIVKTIDRTTIEEGGIKISLSPLEKVYNTFYINYCRNPLTGNYERLRYLHKLDTNMTSNTRAGTPNTYTGLCSNSETKYLTANSFTFNANWIGVDDATADLLLKWFAEWFCYRKYIPEIINAGLDHLELELGDQVLINHTLLPTGISNTKNFMAFSINHDLNENKMTFKFIQIPDLLP